MLLFFSIIGSIGSLFLPYPQAKRAYKVSTDGVSLATYLGLFSVAIIWVPHGFMNDIPLLAISNFLATFFIFTVIYSIARDKKNYKIVLGSIAMALFLELFLHSSLVFFILLYLILILGLPHFLTLI